MIRFGVAGYPPAFAASPYRKNRMQIFPWLQELGLDALELQMTYGPRTSPETCRELRARAQDAGITLSVHAAYFIVFTSADAVKIQQSTETLKRTYDLADLLGATTVVLHPGPLYAGSAADATARFTEHAGAALHGIGKTDIGLFAETAGKLGQLGSVDDILTICRQVPGVYPCVDFGHVHARTLGTLESPAAIAALGNRLATHLGQASPRIHFHYTPIHFGKRGEIQHRALADTYPPRPQGTLFGDHSHDHSHGESSADGRYHPRPEPVAQALKALGISCTVISETLNSQEQGALALKRAFGGQLAA